MRISRDELIQHAPFLDHVSNAIFLPDGFNTTQILEIISALSNSTGGFIIFGARRYQYNFYFIKHVVCRSSIIEALKTRISEALNEPINLEFIEFDINDTMLLAVKIPEAKVKPMFFKTINNTFICDGQDIKRASSYERGLLQKGTLLYQADNKKTAPVPKPGETARKILNTIKQEPTGTIADLAASFKC